MKSGPQAPRTESRPRSDAGKKWRRGTPETRDLSAFGAVQPYAGPGMPLPAPGARDSKPRVQTRGSPRLVPCAPQLSFSAAPAGHFPACAQHKAGTRGPPVAAAPAAPVRGFGRGGPHRSGAPGSGARKCTQTINFPRPPTHPARRSEAKVRRRPPAPRSPRAGDATRGQAQLVPAATPGPAHRGPATARAPGQRRLPAPAREAKVRARRTARERPGLEGRPGEGGRGAAVASNSWISPSRRGGSQ